MAMVLARCSLAPPWPHFRFQRLHPANRPMLRTQAIPPNKTAVVKKKVVKKKKKKDKGEKSPREEPIADEDYTDIVDMEDWMRNKPPGFGLGKEYDTSLEEQIMVEMEQGSAAKNMKKNNPGEPKTVNQMGRITLQNVKLGEAAGIKSISSKKPEQVDGIKVKITHLPRKKNISRDLRLAFKGVSGLLLIRPNELANKKTREPICKGSAMLTFAKEDQAVRFMEKFRDRKLGFGKLEKLPTYELYVPKTEKKKQATEDRDELDVEERDSSTDEDCSDTVQALESDDDEVQELVADTMVDDDDESEEQDEDDEDDEEIDDEEIEDEDEDDEEEGGFETSSAALSIEFEDFDDDVDDVDLVNEEDDSDGEWIEEVNEEDDENETSRGGGIELLEASGGGDTHFVEVDVSIPLTINDVGGDPEEVILSSNARIMELDKEIGKLQKSLKRKRKNSPELKQQILKLREEKIELLEKRVLARIVAAREAHKARRAKKLAAAEEESFKRSGRMDDEKWREVVAKHFSGKADETAIVD